MARILVVDDIGDNVKLLQFMIPEMDGIAVLRETKIDPQLGLVNDILDLSKVEAGKMTIESVPFSIRDLLAELADLLRPMAGPRGSSWRSRFPNRCRRSCCLTRPGCGRSC